MDIVNTYSYAFSIKGTTEKVVKGVASVFPNVSHTDVTKKLEEFTFTQSDLLIIGVPVYGGRIPNVMVKRLESLKGNNTPAIAIITYGNAEYGDALLELKDSLTKQGFDVVGGGIFVAEHSLAPTVATGRPHEKDMQIARSFGEKILQKLSSVQNIKELQPINVPGNYPYKKSSGSHKIESDRDLNPFMRKVVHFLLPFIFKGEKHPEIFG